MGAGTLPTSDAEILARIIEREGGDRFTDNPADRGGPSKFGVTLALLADRRPGATREDVRRLTYVEAAEILQDEFLLKPGFDFSLPYTPLRWSVVDCAVNHGARAAKRLLQRAVGVKDDGIVGPLTLQAVAQAHQHRLAIRVQTMRARFYAAITAGNLADHDRDGVPDNLEMLKGWTDRAMDMIEELVAA